MKGFSAIHVLFAVFTLIVGLVVGGLGPRNELHRVRGKLEDLEAKPCRNNTGADIAKIFQGRPWEEADDSGPPLKGARPPAPAQVVENEPESEGEGGGLKFTFNAGGDKGDQPKPEDIAEAMDLAREALDLRHQQAMAALEEDAQPTPEQQERIDQTLGRMNDDLIRLANELKGQMQEGAEPSRRDAMLYAAETLDVFLSAEDDLRAAFTEDQLANLQDESLDPMSYVDPTLIDVLQDLNR